MHADVLGALTTALSQHAELAAPVCGALHKLVMSKQQREACVDAVMAHLSGAPAHDVHDLAFFALQHCSPGKHAVSVCKVCSSSAILQCYNIQIMVGLFFVASDK